MAFICGSISAPGLAEAPNHWKDFPLRPLFVSKRAGRRARIDDQPDGEARRQAALEYARSGDLAKAAHAVTNPDNAPHLEFVDMGGHGYAVVSAGPDAIETEFVCILRPIVRASDPGRRSAALPCIASGETVAARHAAEAGAAGA